MNFQHNPVSTDPHNTDFFPGGVSDVKRDGATILFRSERGVMLRLQAVSDSVIRLCYATEGFFDADFSYAIYKDYESSFAHLELTEEETGWSVTTATVQVRVSRSDMRVAFFSVDGGIEINRDEKGFHWEPHPEFGGNIVKMSKHVYPGEHYFGLGDKATSMNLRGKRFMNWATDEYGFGVERDPLYKAIPFYIGVQQQKAYGIFFDNTFKSYFDFASERKTATSFWAHGGQMNYYFIYGPDAISVVERYTNLTGKPELPPKWALGYHQCKWSYYPEEKVREIAREFRERQIPCDALYLDIDYMDGYRCFTWDKEKFPEPTQMISDLARDGYKVVTIIDPGIKIDRNYWVFNEGFEKGYFCKRADGVNMKGKVWPGDCYFPDFTRPEVREWWAGLFKGLIAENGIRGIWNDMNEPAIFEVESKTFPGDVRHNYDGHDCSHRKAHNVFGMQMARATFHGVKNFARPNRPFIITRSAYSGTQRYSASWTGDNIASWEHLWVANMQCQRMSISGFSFIGSDIGGFTEHPTSELYTRWIQLAVFHPLMRTHSSGDHGDQEPWSFSPASLAITKKFIELRYRLLPYQYTTFWTYVTTGTPMLRPLSLVHMDDPNALNRNDEFFSGQHLLVAPVVEAGAESRYVYFPQGKWYNYFTHEILSQPGEQRVAAPLELMPLFVRAGAVIPQYPVMQYVDERPLDKMELWVYYSTERVQSELYEDEGDGYEYRKGVFNHKVFTTRGTDKSQLLGQNVRGKFRESYEIYEIHLVGLPFVPSKVSLDDLEIEVDFHQGENGHWVVEVPRQFDVLKVE
ncbi:MAG: glycoside hydrolase family 31 protein [Bacteroidia bacterium]|nr:glycoside hydrolase family 31 protein [Bacteroidia bacterium]